MSKKKSKASKPETDKKPPKKRPVKKGAKGAKKKTDDRPRLQRVMASAGIGSRRECELIIEEGRVEIDGQIVTKLGIKVDPAKHEIFVDAQKLVIQGMQYFILNKPPGVVSTTKDPSGRARVIDLINTDSRVYNVGRLDKASEGLILVTNDGELANRLTHPRYGIEKKYHVHVVGVPENRDLKKLEQGVYLAEGIAKCSKVKFLKKHKNGCWLEMILDEGRNREIRRMLASIGHKVRILKRVAIGPLKLGDLPVGAHRRLFSTELRSLRKAASGEVKARKPFQKPVRPVKRKEESEEKESTQTSGDRSSRSSTDRSSRKPSDRSSRSSTERPKRSSTDRSTRTSTERPKRSSTERSARSSADSSKRKSTDGPKKKIGAKSGSGARATGGARSSGGLATRGTKKGVKKGGRDSSRKSEPAKRGAARNKPAKAKGGKPGGKPKRGAPKRGKRK